MNFFCAEDGLGRIGSVRNMGSIPGLTAGEGIGYNSKKGSPIYVQRVIMIISMRFCESEGWITTV